MFPTVRNATAPLLLAAVTAPLTAQAPGDTVARTIPGTDVGFVEVFVPAGTFTLGSPPDEAGRRPDEGPRRSVSVSAFWMVATEVTQAEYAVFRRRRLDSDATGDAARTMDADAVSRPSPPYEDPAHGMGGPDHPATGMTQLAALRYARWLSRKTGRLYRLPTEAEWEYACRSGREGGTEGAMAGQAWFIDNSGEVTHAVGTAQANSWGIHDLLGNVAEWTLDQYRADFYEGLTDGARDPWSRPTAAHPRTVRGGAFDDRAEDVRCSARLESTLDWKRRDPQIPKSVWWNTDSPHVGFRLVRPAGDFSLQEIEAYWEEVLGPES